MCILDVDLGGSFAVSYLNRILMKKYMKGVVDMHRKFADQSKRGGISVSDPPPPLPLLSKALTAAAKKGGARLTTNPFFASLQTTPSVADGLNVEMGRIIKKSTSKGNRENEDITVL